MSLPKHNHSNLTQEGWIEVICGCMFSGKSSEGAKRINKELLAKNRKPLIFVPQKAQREVTLIKTGQSVDTTGKMVSRTGTIFEAIEFNEYNPVEIITIIESQEEKPTTVVIEEAHFCNKNLVPVCKQLAEKLKLRVIVIGLDQTFDDQGFGPIPDLMVEAEYITKELAVCVECGSQNASKSWLNQENRKELAGKVLVGDEQYIALCRHCKNKYNEQN